jgi:FixJ family two-component response regulator
MPMYDQDQDFPAAGIRVSLVDGDPSVRRGRQLMLRAEHFDVRAYPTCNALLADAGSLLTICLVADLDMPGIDGFDLVRRMRGAGWQGSAILLSDLAPPAARMVEGGVALLNPKAVADRVLLDAIRTTIRGHREPAQPRSRTMP